MKQLPKMFGRPLFAASVAVIALVGTATLIEAVQPVYGAEEQQELLSSAAGLKPIFPG